MTHDPSPASAFASLAELRAVQARLGEQRRSAPGPALWDAAEDFVQRGAATGVVLDSEDERWSVQGLLDYWVTALERAGRPRRESSLAEFDPEQAPELPDDACPYLGLSAFQEANGEVFFGREAMVDKLVAELAERRLIALVGPSGSGKSSLALAGVVRRLRRGGLPGAAAWRILPPMVPGAAPRAALARRLADAAPAGAGSADSAGGEDGAPGLVLVVDQFEELFTMCESETERAAFVTDLLALVVTPSPPHRVVLTVRSDFESFVARHPALYERYAAGRVAVTPPSAAELRQAIEGPARLVGLKFEAGVIDRLLQDLLGEPAGLPLLQFTLLRLWEERHRNRVTAAAYERVGGGRQALARTADAIYDAMLPEDQATARRVFLLVGLAVDDRHEATRARVPRAQFFDHGDDPGRVERVLDRLIRARLLRQTQAEAQPQAQTQAQAHIEVAHEALVRNWPRLAEWLQEAQASLAERRRLEAKARDWVRFGRREAAALGEIELHDAERWLESSRSVGLVPSADLEALLASSRHRARWARRRHRFWIARLIGVAVTLAAMLAITIWQYHAAGVAAARQHDAEQRHARDTELMFAQSELEQGRDLLLGSSVAHPLRALAYLVDALARGADSPTLRILFAQAAMSTPLVVLIGHRDSVYQAEWSGDGTRVLTASEDGTARVWNATTGEPVGKALAHGDAVTAAAFSPDATRVVTASEDNTARVWVASTGAPVSGELRHAAAVTAAGFSPDGTRVITASKDSTAQIWDATLGVSLAGPLTHGEPITAAAFSPDGARAITASKDHTAQIWDATTGARLATLQHRGPVAAAAFSPDGKQAVTASDDGTAQIWDATTGARLAALQHPGPVASAAFSPDGTQVVTASSDRAARVWNARTGEVVVVLNHHGRVTTAAFSRDGTRVVTASRDKTARVWSAETGKPITTWLEHPARVMAAAFSPEGTRVVTTGDDNVVRIWAARPAMPVTLVLGEPPADGAPVRPDGGDELVWRTRSAPRDDAVVPVAGAAARGSGAAPTAAPARDAKEPRIDRVNERMAIAFSPDGTRLVVASSAGAAGEVHGAAGNAGAARVWNAVTGSPVTAPLVHGGPVTTVAFSPDGTRVVTASADGTARVWNAATGAPATGPLGHGGLVSAALFSPDGTRVVTASADRTARVWDARTGAALTPPLRHGDAVALAVWSRDGARIATASFDRTARVWDARTGAALTAPLAHDGAVTAVVWSPDGARIATASADSMARIWNIADGAQAAMTFTHHRAVTSVAFDRDGKRLVTASQDATARVWNTETGKPVTPPLEHQGGVTVAGFSPDGAWVGTASEDGTSQIWDATTGKPVTAALERPGRVHAATFSANGMRAAVAAGGQVFVWGLPIAPGSLDEWRAIARCSPFAIEGGVFTTNSAPSAVCERPR